VGLLQPAAAHFAVRAIEQAFFELDLRCSGDGSRSPITVVIRTQCGISLSFMSSIRAHDCCKLPVGKDLSLPGGAGSRYRE